MPDEYPKVLTRPLRLKLSDLNRIIQDDWPHSPQTVLQSLMMEVWPLLQRAELELETYERFRADLIGDPFKIMEQFILPRATTEESQAQMVRGCVVLLNRVIAATRSSLSIHFSLHPTQIGIGVTVDKKIRLVDIPLPSPPDADDEEEPDYDDR